VIYRERRIGFASSRNRRLQVLYSGRSSGSVPARRLTAVNDEPGLTDTIHFRTIDALQKALDQTYRRLIETARTDWKLLFAGREPADGSVSVRISDDELAEELGGIPHAGFGQQHRKSLNRKISRRLASADRRSKDNRSARTP